MLFKGFKCQNNFSCYKLNVYNNNLERLICIFCYKYLNLNMIVVIYMYFKIIKYVEILFILFNKNLNNVQLFVFFKE